MNKPKNYYCHRGIANQHHKIGQKRFQLVQKIGQGSFGEVFKAFDPESSQLVVVKKFKKGDCFPQQQARILSELTSSEGFDKLKTVTNLGINSIISQKTQQSIQQKSEQKQKQNIGNSIIMGCLGPSTNFIIKKIKKMNIYSMKRIAYQVLKKLRQIHNKLYVHRDIKPDNILLGNKYDSHSIYIIDFGLTTSYKKSSIKARKVYQTIVGTAKYCPIASHLGLQQFPKDDLQSLGYVLLYYICGELPWQKYQKPSLNLNDDQLFSAIHKKKQESTIEQLCGGVNCLRKYWVKLKQLKIGQRIDYDELLEIFDVGEKHNYKQNCFQFCQDCWTREKYSNDSHNDYVGNSNDYKRATGREQQNKGNSSNNRQVIHEPKINSIKRSVIS